MENNRLRFFILGVCYFYIAAFFIFSALLIHTGLDVFYDDYDDYCTFVSKDDSYDFMTEGNGYCKIQWGYFLGLHAYYLFVFILANAIVSLPAILVIRKIKLK